MVYAKDINIDISSESLSGIKSLLSGIEVHHRIYSPQDLMDLGIGKKNSEILYNDTDPVFGGGAGWFYVSELVYTIDFTFENRGEATGETETTGKRKYKKRATSGSELVKKELAERTSEDFEVYGEDEKFDLYEQKMKMGNVTCYVPVFEGGRYRGPKKIVRGRLPSDGVGSYEKFKDFLEFPEKNEIWYSNFLNIMAGVRDKDIVDIVKINGDTILTSTAAEFFSEAGEDVVERINQIKKNPRGIKEGIDDLASEIKSFLKTKTEK